MIEHFLWTLLGAGFLSAVLILWIGIAYWLTPHLNELDGKARITGSCGDTMEICLSFDKGRVSKTSQYTDGCAYSLNCVHAAAELAKGKTPDEIIEIDAELIRDSVGGLPSDHMHCANPASETLINALDDYMRKGRREKKLKHEPTSQNNELSFFPTIPLQRTSLFWVLTLDRNTFYSYLT